MSDSRPLNVYRGFLNAAGGPKSACRVRVPCPRRGFTLIEVLIAIALLMMLVGTMFGFLFDMLNSRARALEFARQQDAASTLIKLLDADLTLCVAGDRVSGSGVSGDTTRLRVLSRGVAANLAQRGEDDPDVFGDLQFAEYRFNSQSHRIEGRRGPAAPNTVISPTASYSPLEGTVHNLRFRYYDGTSWTNSFDSLSANRLPLAVEAAIWFNPVQDQENDDPIFVANANQNDEPQPPDDGLEPVQENGAALGDTNAREQRPPDRIRVFLIPDADGAAAHQPDWRDEARLDGDVDRP